MVVVYCWYIGGGGGGVLVMVYWWQKWKSNVGVELRLGREVVFVLTNGRKWEHPIRGQCSNYSATKNLQINCDKF